MTLLVRGAEVVVTMDSARREIRGGSVLVSGREVQAVGTREEIDRLVERSPAKPTKTIDAKGCVVLPGLVNGHHHMFQSLTRVVGTGKGYGLFDWLKLLYAAWRHLDPESAHVSAKTALSELLLSGATTVADHLYLYPNGVRLEDTIRAARELGVRFHPTRGAMTLGEKDGSFVPDDLVERDEDVLADCLRLVEDMHDPGRHSMLRIGLAPCSPFNATGSLMRETAKMARAHRAVGLHTHLCETLDEERFCLERFGKRPIEFVAELGWVGPDVWYAHMVHPSAEEVAFMGRHRCGVCHCPSSNMLLASGMAPVRAMVDHGVRVGLGVDGTASNDGNHLLGEARQAMLLQRVGWPGFESRADRFSAREALELATRGGAALLGREDIGSLEPGKAADLVAFRVDGLEHAGAQGDIVAGLLTCTPGRAWLSVIDGKVVVESGSIVGVDIGRLVEQHNRASLAMLRKAGLA
ncbi:MAG: 8-oxoguanine deaminase [Betaproteobacteria bacterium]|nr:8-oxoguanine deaminase [Betaproteobacteria bacterium]